MKKAIMICLVMGLLILGGLSRLKPVQKNIPRDQGYKQREDMETILQESAAEPRTEQEEVKLKEYELQVITELSEASEVKADPILEASKSEQIIQDTQSTDIHPHISETEPEESISKEAHNFIIETTEPTCTEAGFSKKYCSTCNEMIFDTVLPPKGHIMTESWWWQPSCTETGYRNIMCSVCGFVDETNSGTIERLQHSIQELEIQKGNCMKDTIIQHICSLCKEIIEEERYTEQDHHNWITDEEGTYCEWCGISSQ